MLKLGTIALTALILNIAFSSDSEASVSEGDGPRFECQVDQRLGASQDSLRMLISVSVPYDNLAFLRDADGFKAEIEVVVSILSGSDLVEERFRKSEVSTILFANTNSRTKRATHSEEFLLPPGSYSMRVTMTDLETRKKSRWSDRVVLAEIDPLLRVSDLFWVPDNDSLEALGTPKVTENFTTSGGYLTARVEVYSNGTDPIKLYWHLIGEKQDTVHMETAVMVPGSDANVRELELNLGKLNPQRYTLVFEAVGNGRREVRKRSFMVRFPGMPSSIIDLDRAIRQVKYIANTSENRALRKAPPGEKGRLFREFWKSRDPTPNTVANELMDEYYRRIEYSDTHFSTHREGWETDRGRIYILYGPPTSIERHPFEAGSRPYEIWFYINLARQFIFVDETGFGDYKLIGPQLGY